MNITEFLEARIAEDEAVARDAIEDDSGSDEGFSMQYELMTKPPSGLGYAKGGFGAAAARMIATYAVPARILAECAAKRAIIKQHEQWPVYMESEPSGLEQVASGLNDITYRITRQMAWLTTREYVKKFGVEPPTAPMIAALAAVYKEHPDYQQEWA